MISPFNEHFEDREVLLAHAMGKSEMLVILPPDDRLITDLLMYKRTEKYIQQNTTINQPETVQHILTEKNFQNTNRSKQMESRVRSLLLEAKIYVGGTEILIPSMDAQTRIYRGYHELIRQTYPNLNMLHKVVYSEIDIENYLRLVPGLLPVEDPNTLTEAEHEILNVIQGNKHSGTRTTIKSLTDKFEKKPYGWPLAAVECTLALLSAHGKVEMNMDGNILEDAALIKAIKNTQSHQSVVLEPQIEFGAEKVRKLKEFYEDFFDLTPQSNEAKELGKETAKALDEKLGQIKPLLGYSTLYPFLTELSGPIELIKGLTGKQYSYYLTDFPAQMEALLDMKEKIIAPIMQFWMGSQKVTYEEARLFQQKQEPNFDSLSGDEVGQLKQILADPQIFKTIQFPKFAR